VITLSFRRLALPTLTLAFALAFVSGCTAAGGPPAQGGGGATSGCPTSQPAPMPLGQTRTVTLATTKGQIVIAVKSDLSPIAVANFVALASCGYYNGSPFHRVVPGFVIQGGVKADGSRLGYTIEDEPVTATYHRATVAMAKTGSPNSATSQFFICLDDSTAASLPDSGTYQIMGEVTSGMDTVDAIAGAADAEHPSNPVIITTATVTNP